jgi:hypothetical protein
MYSEKKCIALEKKCIDLENRCNDLEISNSLNWIIKPIYFIYHISYLSEYAEIKINICENIAFTMLFLFNCYLVKRFLLILIYVIMYCYNKFNNIVIINLNINKFKYK